MCTSGGVNVLRALVFDGVLFSSDVKAKNFFAEIPSVFVVTDTN